MAVARAIGLDIGSNSIKMVELERSKKGGHNLQFVGIAPLPDGSIVEKQLKKPDVVARAIKSLHSYTVGRTKDVSISLAGKSVIVKQVAMTSMSDEQLEKQISIEAEPYIPFDIKDVNIDWYIMGNKTDKENQMDVVLVAAKQDFLNSYIDLLKSCNLNPVVIDVDPFALEVMYENFYSLVPEEIIAIINVGANAININILDKMACKYTRDLPLGGDMITREIMRFFDVSYEKAEDIKRGARLDKINARNLRRIFSKSVENYVSEIRKIIDFFSQNISYDPIQKIFLCGGGARTYGFSAALESELNVPVEIVNPFDYLKYDSQKIDPQYLEEIGPQMAVAVGLALRTEDDKVK